MLGSSYKGMAMNKPTYSALMLASAILSVLTSTSPAEAGRACLGLIFQGAL